MSDLSVFTYHCICTELVAATSAPIDQLPRRRLDNSTIGKTVDSYSKDAITLRSPSVLQSRAIVLKLEDGFETRYLLDCARCDLTLGYRLDRAQFDPQQDGSGPFEEVVYLLPDAVVSTEAMMKPTGRKEA